LLLVICFQWNYPAFGLELEMACCFCPSLGEGNEILLLLELSNWFGTWDSIWPVKQALINTSTFIFLFLLSIYNVVLSRSNGKFVIGFSLY
jgi:hypothetical protein